MRSDVDMRRFAAHGLVRVPGVVSPEEVRAWRYQLYGLGCGCGRIAPGYCHNMTWESRAGELLGAALRPGRIEDVTLEFPFYLRPRAINDWPPLAAFMGHPAIARAVRAHLGGRAHATEAALLIHEPGTPAGAWRASGAFNAHLAPNVGASYLPGARGLALHLLVTDFTRANGGLRVVPGSHRRPTNPSHEPRERRVRREKGETALTGRAGDVFVLDGRLWHAVAENRSDFMRMSVVVELGDGRGPVPAFPRMAPAVFQGLPPPVRPLFDGWVAPKARR